MNPETIRTSELNTVDCWNKENLPNGKCCVISLDMLTSLGQPLGSANNKAKTLQI